MRADLIVKGSKIHPYHGYLLECLMYKSGNFFVFFGNLENLGFFKKKKKSFVDGYAARSQNLSKPPTFSFSLSGEFSHCGDQTI